MFAVAGIIAAVIAALLQLVKQRQNAVIWLVIIAVVLVGIEVAWGWRRGGYYRRP
jgi:hypothetical protein